MSSKSPIEIAKAYVAASNAHDVNTIEAMLSADCVYESSGVGNHSRRDTILEMMRGFFAANPGVLWDTRNWALDGADTAVFDFTITLASGASEGREWISVNSDGLISHIKVAR